MTWLLILIIGGAFDVSRYLINDFIFSPASGNPDFYKIYKRLDTEAEWTLYGTCPATTEIYQGAGEYNGKPVVRCTIVSFREENYQIRVEAVDAAGNTGPPSESSNLLYIRTATYPTAVHGDD